ncbi:MAG: hypothetical protein AABO57_18610 [Acidobacteriota bacterium]
MRRTLTLVLLLVLTACSTNERASNNNSGKTPSAGNQPSQPTQQQASAPGALREGEASGTIIVEGQTVTLKYAYAGHGKMFGEDAVLLLVTDTPISAEAQAKAFEEYGQFPEGARGLQYKVGKGFWVMYHPGNFQTSGINTLKDYTVENGVVKGRDEDGTTFDGKDYKRSVSFVARLPEKKS